MQLAQQNQARWTDALDAIKQKAAKAASTAEAAMDAIRQQHAEEQAALQQQAANQAADAQSVLLAAQQTFAVRWTLAAGGSDLNLLYLCDRSAFACTTWRPMRTTLDCIHSFIHHFMCLLQRGTCRD